MQRRSFLSLARWAAMLGVASAAIRPAWALPDPPAAGMVRRYINGRYGQIHLRIASPANGVERFPPLLLFHQTPLSGRMFERIMPHLAVHRRVIAVDTPGYGESDRPATRPSLTGYSDAIVAAVSSQLKLRRFDMLGYHTGAVIAADIAARYGGARGKARRLILVSMPYFDAERRGALLTDLDAPDGPGEPFADDGSHLVAHWKGSFSTRAAGQSIDDVARLAAEKQRAGRYNVWALRSAMDGDLSAMLAAIDRPTLVMAPHDGLQDASTRAAGAIKAARLIDLPEQKYGLFDGAPAMLAAHILPFLGG